jgi:hypothetical protein
VGHRILDSRGLAATRNHLHNSIPREQRLIRKFLNRASVPFDGVLPHGSRNRGIITSHLTWDFTSILMEQLGSEFDLLPAPHSNPELVARLTTTVFFIFLRQLTGLLKMSLRLGCGLLSKLTQFLRTTALDRLQLRNHHCMHNNLVP